MATTSSALSVDQRIIELESEITERRFIKRFTLLWMLLGTPLFAGAVAALVLFINWSNRSDQVALGLFGAGACLVSTLAAVHRWYKLRTGVRTAEVEVHQLHLKRHSLQAAQTDARALPTAFHSYYESVPGFRDEYRRSAERYRSRHNVFQLTVIVGSILTSVSTTAAAEEGVWSWLAVGISALVSISAGVIAYFKFRERSLNLQQTADSIDLEIQAYALRIRRYKGRSPEEASALFAEEVERIREEQRKKELQLEQPPEAAPQQRVQPGP